jgi:pimeloyl-ACP methyl ester carboxylesterase
MMAAAAGPYLGRAVRALGSLFLGAPLRDDAVALSTAEEAFDVTHRLCELVTPTLVIAGQRDAFFPPDLACATVAALPGSQLLLVRGCPHATTALSRHVPRKMARFIRAHR